MRAVRSNAGMKSDEASVFCTTSTFATMVKSEVWIKSYGLLKIFKITRIKSAVPYGAFLKPLECLKLFNICLE